jgi:hypothetical protein
MEEKDQKLWAIAKKRAAFKKSLYTYFIVNAFLWILWYLNGAHLSGRNIPWPVWPMLGWGIGLAFQYYDAYENTKNSLIEKEYEKLKNKQ